MIEWLTLAGGVLTAAGIVEVPMKSSLAILVDSVRALLPDDFIAAFSNMLPLEDSWAPPTERFFFGVAFLDGVAFLAGVAFFTGVGALAFLALQ